MTRHRLAAPILAATILAAAGCSGEPAPTRSPFAGTGAFATPGIVGAVFVADIAGELDLDGEAATVDAVLYLLDGGVYGSELAVDLGGHGAEAALATVVERGWLERVDRREETYRLAGFPAAAAPFLRPAGGASRLERLGRVGPGLLGAEFRRFDAGGRVLLLPTIDLRHVATPLGERIRDDLAGSSFAFVLDGDEASSLLRRRILPTFEGASTIFTAAMRGRGERAVEGAAFGMALLAEVLDQCEGLTFAAHAPGQPIELRVTPRPETAVRRLCASLRSLDGRWPRRGGEWELVASLDGGELAEAVAALVEEPLLDRSPALVEQVEDGLAVWRRLGVDGIAAGAGGVALRVGGAPRVADLAALAPLLGAAPEVEGRWLRSEGGAAWADTVVPADASASVWARLGSLPDGWPLEITLTWDGETLVGEVGTN